MEELTAALVIDEQSANERGLLLAASLYWHLRQHDKAREYSQKVLDSQPNYLPAQVYIFTSLSL